MVSALADEIAGRLKARVAADGEASLVVTGGSTPGALYDALSRRDTAWDQVSLTLTDERWVAADSEASNERLVRERLLRGEAKAARLVPLKTGDATPATAAAGVSKALAAMPRPFEVVILGMGADGHFASLFPGNPGLAQGLAGSTDIIAIEAPGAAGSPSRLSLTLRALLDTRWIVVLVRGDEKLQVLRQAMAGDDSQGLPIAAVVHQTGVPVSLFWAP